MACFLVPAVEAVVTTLATQGLKKKEKHMTTPATEAKLPFSVKLGWLNKLLWGGSGLLAFEHLWHGEISPVFPFLTAASTGQTAEMLREMATAGVGMAGLVTLVWVGMVAASAVFEKRARKECANSPQEALK